MSTTVNSLQAQVSARFNDSANTVFSAAEVKDYVRSAINGLYPRHYALSTATTVAGAGPIQTMPALCSNVYYVGLQGATSTRVRQIRGWSEGSGQAIIPKLGISGQTLVWAWTVGFSAPAVDTDPTNTPHNSEEDILLRAQITCCERLLSDIVKLQKYLAVNVRQGVTEVDIGNTLDALHASLEERRAYLRPLPEVRK